MQTKHVSANQKKSNFSKENYMTGSEILLQSLLLEGVDCVFGYPGGAVLNIYDAIHNEQKFNHLLTRHEQGAIHAADGYARSTGKTGVCIATSGPGATNLVTGIATAHMDSVPLVIVTGNVPTDQLGTDAFQEADIIGITMPITKHSFQVQKVEDLPEIIHKAFKIASSGRKGPVLIDIPKDVSANKMNFYYPPQKEERNNKEVEFIDDIQILSLIDAINQSKKPIILSGGGVISSGAHKELFEFVNKTQIPTISTLLGLGAFPSSHSLSIGMPGMHGTYAANTAIQNCDLLISIGARFDDRVTMKVNGFAPNAKIAHIDIDPAEVNKTLSTFIPCIGDIKLILNKINQLITQPLNHDDWINEVKEYDSKQPLNYRNDDNTLKPQYVIEMISKTTNGEAIITTDVGQHQMWVAQYYKFKNPRSFITSGGLGTMGFGLPSAIGAQVGNPNSLVVSVNGDGGIQMCIQELALCSTYNLPIKIVVLNNKILGMVRQWQEIAYDERYSEIDLSGPPNLLHIAEAYGIKFFKAENNTEAQLVWDKALKHPGPALIEFMIPSDESVLPMVMSGHTISEMILED